MGHLFGTSVQGFVKNWAWFEIAKKFTRETLPNPF